MEILATARHGMGGEFKLVKVSDDFFMYGTQQEFNSICGVSVDRCGTLVEVLSHCLRIAELCKNNIAKYKAEMAKSTKKDGWQMLIDCEKSELDMLLLFAETLKSIQGGISALFAVAVLEVLGGSIPSAVFRNNATQAAMFQPVLLFFNHFIIIVCNA